jgi:hypothetical protein
VNEILNAAWRATCSTIAAKLVLLRLADMANEKGICWPSVAKIAKDCGLGERTAQRAIKANIADGHIEVTATARTSTYAVHPRQFDTPANLAPVPEVTVTPVNLAGAPPSKTTITPANLAPKPSLTLSPTNTNHHPRKRDSVLDALVGLDGSDPLKSTKPAFSAAAKARNTIKSVTPDLTVQEIQRRAANYRSHFPRISCSANALAKHWAKCDSGITSSPTPKLPKHVTGAIEL